MTSLAEVYERRLNEVENVERLYLGFGLLTLGAISVFVGGMIAVFDFTSTLVNTTQPWERWGIGAILAGIGVPAAFTGVFIVLPNSSVDKKIGFLGVAIMIVGVGLFRYAYPHKWSGDPLDLTWLVFFVYAIGAVIDFWSLFRAIINLELSIPRNSLSLEYVTESGEKREITLEPNDMGSTVGVSGIDWSDQSNDAVFMSSSSSATKITSTKRSESEGESGSQSDGTEIMESGSHTGSAKNKKDKKEEKSDGAEIMESGPMRGNRFNGDRYCGNCVHYDYVKNEDEGRRRPFCQFHDRVLEDLEACEEYDVRAGKVDRI